VIRRLTHIFALAAVAALLVPAAAYASSRQWTVAQDDARLLAFGPGARLDTLNEFKAFGVDVVKVQVNWRDIAPQPESTTKPAGFNGADPLSPLYNWTALDGVVRDATALGMRVYLALGGRSPDWAAARRVARYGGVYRPSANEFGQFAQAIGTRYTGLSLGGLPRVSIWSVWNEPNLFSWLQPQRTRGGTPLAPVIYRNLYLAAHAGLDRSGHGRDTILLGELAPIGAGAKTRIAPLAFLREMVCLDRRYRPYRGRAARARGCPGRVGRIPTSGLAHHPYVKRRGIRDTGRAPDEVTISSLSRASRALDAIARRGRLPRRLPIYITEYGFQTNPPDRFQHPLRSVPGYMDESEWIAFRNGRVRSYSQYSLFDDPLNPVSGPRRYERWQGGLRFANGAIKPGVYDAFRTPFFVRFLGGTRVEVWGAYRPGTPGQTGALLVRQGRGPWTSLGTVTLNRAGYFRRVVRVRSPVTRTFRVQFGNFTRTRKPVRR
jgi:hypothetical protein